MYEHEAHNPTAEEKATIVRIEYWYNRSARVWTIQCKDADDYQVGPAIYDGNLDDLKIDLDDLKREYALTPVKTKAC